MHVSTDFRSHQSEVDVEQRRASHIANRYSRLDSRHEPPTKIIGSPKRVLSGCITADYNPLYSNRNENHQRIKQNEARKRSKQPLDVTVFFFDYNRVGQIW